MSQYETAAGSCSTVRFIINNAVKDSALSASHELPMDMHVNNLKTEWRSRIMRHTMIHEVLTISGNVSQHRTFSAFALSGFNITPSGYVVIRIYDNGTNGKKLLFESEQLTASLLSPQGEFIWGVDAWGLSSNDGVNPTFSYYFEELIGNYYEIDIYDPLSFDGYVDIKQIFLGDTLSLDNNFSYGMSIQWQSAQEQVRTEGGSLLTLGNNQVWRQINLPFDYMIESDREKLSYQQRLRSGEAIFVSAFPNGNEVKKREFSMVAKFPPPTFTHSQFGAWQSALELREV